MGIWGDDSRLDWYQVKDEYVRKNANCVAAICNEKNLIETNKGFVALDVKKYGEAFGLCLWEPFFNQPIISGHIGTGFLVGEDVIVTAGHTGRHDNLENLRFVFGFKMLNPSTAVTQIPNENIYKGTKIINRVYNHAINKPEWSLIKLDRKVLGQTVSVLSKKEILLKQPVYMIGHPVGLPLKYAHGAMVREIHETFFSADLDVFVGNSGSPVFNSYTHEVIGITIRGDNRDFRLTGGGWRSVIYPNQALPSKEPGCTKVSEFIKYIY